MEALAAKDQELSQRQKAAIARAGMKGRGTDERKLFRFGVNAVNYRLSLISQDDEKDIKTGKLKRGQNLTANFSDGLYSTRDSEVAKLIYETEAFRLGEIWDEDIIREEAKKARFDQLVGLVTGDEEQLAALLADPRIQERLRAGLNVGKDFSEVTDAEPQSLEGAEPPQLKKGKSGR